MIYTTGEVPEIGARVYPLCTVTVSVDKTQPLWTHKLKKCVGRPFLTGGYIIRGNGNILIVAKHTGEHYPLDRVFLSLDEAKMAAKSSVGNLGEYK